MKKIGCVCLLGALALAGAGCSGGDAATTPGGGGGGNFRQRPGFSGPGSEAPETVSVKAAHAQRRPISTFIVSNTTLESIRKIVIHAKVNALVEAILVEEGDRVRAGQVLAKLDAREIRNEYDQARIAVEQSKLARQQAEVRSELSRANFERTRSLYEQNLISRQEYDQAALVNRTDELALQVAREQTEAAAARLEAAQIQLEYTEITSSIDGAVTERMIEVGSRVQPNQQVFTVEDFTPLWARIFVPEKDLPQLRLGQTAQLRFQAFPDEKFEGRLRLINPAVDAQSGTVKATLEVSDSRGRLRPGMFGSAYIATETRNQAVVIPKRAVLRERDENRVFVINAEGVVEKRTVTLGFSEEEFVEVVSGLREGEALVTVGQEGLGEGYAVNVLAWEDQPGAAAPAVTPVAKGGETAAPAAKPAAETAAPVAQRPSGGPAWGGSQDRAGRPGGGAPDPERVKAFLTRALQNPEIARAYRQELEKDPELANDPQKIREFLRKMGLGRNRPDGQRP